MRTALTCGLLLLAAVSAQPAAACVRTMVPNLPAAVLQLAVQTQRAEVEQATRGADAAPANTAGSVRNVRLALSCPDSLKSCELGRSAASRAP